MYERFMQLLQEKGVTPYRVAKDTGIGQSSLTDWKTGRATPKTDKLQKIADYFGVSLDWLTGASEYRTPQDMWKEFDDNANIEKLLAGVSEVEKTYYTNPETAQMAQEIFESKELRMLFDVTRNSTPQRLKAYHDMIKQLEEQENGGD